MQILPLVTARAQAAANALLQHTEATSRQSTGFANLLDNARSTATTTVAQATTGLNTAAATPAATAASTITEASNTPRSQDMMGLAMTREDLAALHDDLVEQGFSEDELTAMQEKIDSPTGMTWGEMMATVKKKIAKTDKAEKKDVSNDDQVQLLGLFGKLGFTADQSQKMVESLANGDTTSVWSAVNAKVEGLSADDTVSLNASEMATLGRAMNLSEDAQKRIAALFAQSDAENGLSAQGLATAFGLVKNEILAQIGQENQSMAEFRQSASVVLDKAWQSQQNKINSSLHQDDVALKAAQVVAMGGEKSAAQGTPTASQPGVDVLADVPDAGQSPLADTAGTTATSTDTGKAGAHNGQFVFHSVSSDARQGQQAGSELHSRAGAVAAEQAAVSGQAAGTDSATVLAQGVTSDQGAVSGQARLAAQAGETGIGAQHTATGDAAQAQAAQKGAVTTSQFGSGNMDGFGTGQQGTRNGGAFGQGEQEAGWGEFWSKVRVEKSAGRSLGSTSTTSTTGAQTTMAAMDAITGRNSILSAKSADPLLASRAARQLETGILRTIGQDAKQLTLTLSPDELGKLNVMLTVKDKEVRAVITADNPDTASMLQEHAAHLKKTLENQGFKVTRLDVQTGVSQDNQTAWQNPEQHNQAREQREAMDRLRSSQRMVREGTITLEGETMQSIPQAAMSNVEGLDLFA